MSQSSEGVIKKFQDEELIFFREGLFGFENQRSFLPLCVEEGSDAILCLQSTLDEELSFIIMNPFLWLPDYSPVMTASDRANLDVQKNEDLSFYVICVVRDPMEESTVNLKCPIVVNTANRQARQVILDSGDYGFRHTLGELKKEDSVC